MADDDDDNDVHDESAYDLDTVPRARQEEVISMPASSAVPEDSGPAPQWAQKWKETQKAPPKLTGVCVKWNTKGFGFVKRDDSEPDLYVHQRDVQKSGFRSLQEGERLEFDVGAMDDGRLHAVRVTGPGGVDVQGQPKPSRDDSDDDDEPSSRGAGGKMKQPESAAKSAKPYAKPAFLPRVVARPKPPPPKPKPAASAAPPP